MKIYEKIELQLYCEEKENLSNIIVSLKIKAGTKNPYLILFPKTDKYGHSELTKDELIGQFNDHIEMGLMDYNGTLQNAEDEVELDLLDIDRIKKNRKTLESWPLLSHEKNKWKTREEEINYKLTSSNEKYLRNRIVVDISKINKIVYNLKCK